MVLDTGVDPAFPHPILKRKTSADSPAEVVNISLAFGLQDTHCPRCGREAASTHGNGLMRFA